MSHYTGSVPATERARNWRDDALCATEAYADRRDLWFPHPGQQHIAAQAKAVCAACPVRQACLDDAIEEEGGRGIETRHGVRGGMTARQRRALYERRRKAQTKAAAA